VRLGLFGVSGAFAIAYGFLMNSAAKAGQLLQHYGYVVMMGTFLWWVWSVYQSSRPAPGWYPRSSGVFKWAESHRAAILLIAGLTVVAWCTVPYSWKVLYDEMVLQATSFNVHFFHEFGTVARGYDVGGEFRSLDVYVDKRPFFFPFAVSLVHDLTGYRVSNSYWFNTAMMPVVLSLVYAVGRKLGGKWPGLVALVFFGASSLLAQNANGVGMEMLNLAMLLATWWLAIRYLERPDDARMGALILTCVLLTQTRYESAIYVAPVALIILESWRRQARIQLPVIALAAPLLLIPCALHNVYLSGTPQLWELHEDTNSRFGLVYLGENLHRALLYFFNVLGDILNSWWLSVAGFAALIWVVVMLVRHVRKWKTAEAAVAVTVLIGAGVTANLALLMCYYWGQLDEPIVSRLVLPFMVVQSMAIAWCVGRLPGDGAERAGRWLVGGALCAYLGFGLWGSAKNEARNQIAIETMWEEQWLAKQQPASRLMISNKSGLSWLAMGRPTMAIHVAKHRARQIDFHLRAGTFQEVLISQYYRPTGPEGNFVLDPRNALPEAFVLAPVVERQIGGKLLRISRIVRIDLDKIEEEPARPDPVKVAATSSSTNTR
jgi:hypothetical protein